MTGRRTYDIAGAWGGSGPIPGIPVFVLTHRVPKQVPQGESRYTFVTDGVECAIAQAKAAAGDRDVSLMGASVAQQGIRAGLVDEIQIHLVPLLLGGGVRLFEHLGPKGVATSDRPDSRRSWRHPSAISRRALRWVARGVPFRCPFLPASSNILAAKFRHRDPAPTLGIAASILTRK